MTLVLCELSPVGVACVVWLDGVLNGFGSYERVYHLNAFDAPDTLTTGQIQKIVIKCMNDHPTELHLRMSLLVMAALGNAFPAKKKLGAAARHRKLTSKSSGLFQDERALEARFHTV